MFLLLNIGKWRRSVGAGECFKMARVSIKYIVLLLYAACFATAVTWSEAVKSKNKGKTYIFIIIYLVDMKNFCYIQGPSIRKKVNKLCKRNSLRSFNFNMQYLLGVESHGLLFQKSLTLDLFWLIFTLIISLSLQTNQVLC